MRRLRIIAHRFRSLFGRGGQETELATEVDIHLQQLKRELIADGLSDVEAKREARRQFGSPLLAQEQCRDARRVGLVDDLIRDIGFALRLFRKSPRFTLTAVASLVLGIGANASMFQLFEAVRLRALPVQRPEELVSVRIRGEGRSGNFRGRNSQFTYSIWNELQRRQTSFSGVLAYGDTPVNLSPSGELRNVEGLWVSGSFFPTLGVRPQIGRLLSPEDDRPGCGWPGVVISYAFWQREFGGEDAVLSRTLPINGRAVPILGVTPPEFFGVEVGRRFDIAMPICSAAEADLNNRMFWFLTVMGRLKHGVSAETARAELKTLSPPIFEATVPAYQPPDQARYVKLQLDLEAGANGQSNFRETFELALTFLMCMVGLVLLLACANLANIMLARATAREHEFAVRRSLGASRSRLIRQVLIESLLLATAGATLGALAAPVIGRSVIAMLSTQRDPIYLSLDSNWRVLAFTITAAVSATILFGLAPALRAARADDRGSSATREKLVFRRMLLVGQVSLCMVLLTSALLFSRSFRNLLSFNPGFNAHGILVTNVFLDPVQYKPENRMAAIEGFHQRLSSVPGVSGVARSYVIPISGSGWDRGAFTVTNGPTYAVKLTSISEGYFQVMNAPLLAGRDFNANDRPSSTPVAIVNQTFARTLFGSNNPIGRTFRLSPSEPPLEIVGLVADSKYRTLAEEATPIAYLAASQEQPPRTTVRFLIRSAGRPENLVSSVKRVLLDSDPKLTMRFVVLQSQLEESVLRERLLATLSSAFGLLGAMLALTGVFGVTAYLVSRRYREFGVRIALGATGSRIVRLILTEIAFIVLAGITLGGLLALGAGKAVAMVLYGIKPHDVLTLMIVTFTIGVGGLAAALIPALRAARVAPMDALRVE